MDDVQRVFRQLVHALAAHAPERLYEPIPLSEMHDAILPYRRYRRELQFDSVEDYEMAMLRLYAGEGGYVAVEPDEVREFLTREAGAVNPNPGAFRGIGYAMVTLNRTRVRAVLDPRAEYAPPPQEPAIPSREYGPLESAPKESAHEEGSSEFASEWEPPTVAVQPPRVEDPTPRIERPVPPPEPTAEPTTPASDDTADAPRLTQVPLPTCTNCEAALPIWCAVTYCPFCGSRRPQVGCPRCREHVEDGWRFCVACGEPVEDESQGDTPA